MASYIGTTVYYRIAAMSRAIVLQDSRVSPSVPVTMDFTNVKGKAEPFRRIVCLKNYEQKNKSPEEQMKKRMVKGIMVALTIVALTCVWSTGQAQTKQREKGPALQQLEREAGKKIEDVKVPEVPKPTPVNTNQTNSGNKK